MTANNEKVDITMMGTVTVLGEHGVNITLNEARYVPTFATSLISVARLTNNGASVVFTKDGAKLAKDGKTLLSAQRVGDLYYVNDKSFEKAYSVSDDEIAFFINVQVFPVCQLSKKCWTKMLY